jgi:hypothetical protein
MDKIEALDEGASSHFGRQIGRFPERKVSPSS